MRLSRHCSPAARFLVCQSLLACLLATTSHAWIYPEHRDITFLAIRKLDPARRAVLDSLWAEARLGHESRLSVEAADSAQGEKPSTIEYAAWPTEVLREPSVRNNWFAGVRIAFGWRYYLGSGKGGHR